MAGYDIPAVDRMRVVDTPQETSREGAKILYLAQLLPYPADAGPKVRIYHVLRYLAQHNRVTLVAFSRPSDAPEAVTHLKEFCAEVHVVPMQRSRMNDLRAMTESLLGGRSFIIHRDHVPEMAKLVDRLLAEGNFQAVHSDQLWMAQYALRARHFSAAKGSPLRLVLDEHNACFQIFQRLAQGERNPVKKLLLEREWRMLARYEAQTTNQFDQVVTVSEQDRAILQRMTRKPADAVPQFHTIPICVDQAQTEPVQAQPEARNVLHLGTMFWLPNVEGVLWFARHVWPRVLEAVPQATFTIAGKNPPKTIEALADGATVGTNGISPPSRRPAIQVTGYVPDPRPYLEQAGVFIVPLLSGSGMRVKILDAWSWGLPVISTTVGAEGVEYRDGENILIADHPGQFAQAVIRVLCDTDLALKLRRNGRQWVENRYDWRSVYRAWDTVYAGVSGSTGGAHE